MLPAGCLFVILENDTESYSTLTQKFKENGTVAQAFNGQHGSTLLIVDFSNYPVGLDIIPHEITHIVDYIEDYINQEYSRESEYRSYLIGFLNQTIYSIMLDHGYKITKVKKSYVWGKDAIILPDNQDVNKK